MKYRLGRYEEDYDLPYSEKRRKRKLKYVDGYSNKSNKSKIRGCFEDDTSYN